MFPHVARINASKCVKNVQARFSNNVKSSNLIYCRRVNTFPFGRDLKLDSIGLDFRGCSGTRAQLVTYDYNKHDKTAMSSW